MEVSSTTILSGCRFLPVPYSSFETLYNCKFGHNVDNISKWAIKEGVLLVDLNLKDEAQLCNSIP